jgi:nitrate reductase / nitrite oxidoreductase, alpha subunit
MWDEKSQTFAVPNETIGHRWEDQGTWNLQLNNSSNYLGDIEPALTFLGQEDDVVTVQIPHFEAETKTVLNRAVPVKATSKR